MPHPVFRAGARALITGGASGVGLATAKMCAMHSMRLAIVDVNTSALSAAKDLLSKSAEVETYQVDVSQLSQWQSLRKQIETRFGGLDFLMLNAGIGPKGSWEDTDYFHKVMDTNLFGVINGLGQVLDLVTKDDGGPSAVVITGSKQGITNPPGNAAYNASKAAIKTLAEHLSYDLRSSKTSVHLLVPGWTFTGLTGGGAAKAKPDGAWAPEQVAELLGKKMEQGKFYIICPDNDVSEDMDKRRMLYGAGDIVYERPALSRWREDTKDKAAEEIKSMKL